MAKKMKASTVTKEFEDRIDRIIKENKKSLEILSKI